MIEADIYVAYHKNNEKAPVLPGISFLTVFIGLVTGSWGLWTRGWATMGK
jgi:hypothetical protein